MFKRIFFSYKNVRLNKKYGVNLKHSDKKKIFKCEKLIGNSACKIY